jgi:ribosomal-protein-alanine N-acetyltransferase
MSAEISIEPMTAVHVPDVVALEAELFDHPWTTGMFLQEVEDNHLSRPFVALHNGRVVGYLISWFLRDEVHLLNIGVTPRLQRRGIARRFVDHLIALARLERRGWVTLEVRVGNTPALALYESCGFRKVKRRRDYYEDTGEDAIVMVLVLGEKGSGS